MDQVAKYLPYAAAVFSLIGLLYKVAESTRERNKQVKDWLLELLLVAFACAVIVYFGYQCMLFLNSTAPLERREIGNFAINVINVLLYGKLIFNHFAYRISLPNKLKAEELRKERAKLSEELIDMREKRLMAEMRADTAEQLRDFARQLLDTEKRQLGDKAE